MQQLKVLVRGTVQSRGEVAGLLKVPGDVVIIERGTPRWLLMKCPCGCGEDLPVNLDKRAGPAWRLYRNKNRGISLYPSVWRDTGCKSHFILSRGIIYLFARYDDDWDSHDSAASNDLLQTSVLRELPTAELISYVDIADSLGEVPWDVLDVCRQLVREGRAREGHDKQRGHFGALTRKPETQQRSWRA